MKLAIKEKHMEYIKMCPYCNNEMVLGYIPFSTPWWLKWINVKNKKHKFRVSDKVKLSEVNKISNVYYCDKCCIIIKHFKQ